jgi:hypothetical protein
MKIRKEFIVIFLTTLLIAWAFGVLRFENEIFSVLFKVILFPFGFLYTLYETYCMNAFGTSSFLNDEFFQMGIFCVSVILQSLMYYIIFRKIKSYKQSTKAG